jgi:hypothetical protein
MLVQRTGFARPDFGDDEVQGLTDQRRLRGRPDAEEDARPRLAKFGLAPVAAHW